MKNMEGVMENYLEEVFEKSLENYDFDGHGKKNKKLQCIDENVEAVIDFFLKKYHNIIKQAVYESPYCSSELQALSDSDRKLAWKGIIIGNFLSALKVKSFVQEKLREMFLDQDITLREFYLKSDKKIRINFTAVSMDTQTIQILNYITRPNMPLWAAIVATCSLP